MTDREARKCEWMGRAYGNAFWLVHILTWPFRIAELGVEMLVMLPAEAWIRFRERWDAYMEGEWRD